MGELESEKEMRELENKNNMGEVTELAKERETQEITETERRTEGGMLEIES